MGTCSVMPQVASTKYQPGPCQDASTGSGQVSRSKESSIAVPAKQPLLSIVWWTLRQLCNQSLEKPLPRCSAGCPAPRLANRGAESVDASQHLQGNISTNPLLSSACPSLVLDRMGNSIFTSNAVVDCLCNVQMLAQIKLQHLGFEWSLTVTEVTTYK